MPTLSSMNSMPASSHGGDLLLVDRAGGVGDVGLAGAEQLEAVTGAGTVDGGARRRSRSRRAARRRGPRWARRSRSRRRSRRPRPSGSPRNRQGSRSHRWSSWTRRRRRTPRPRGRRRAAGTARAIGFFLNKGCPPWGSNRCPPGDRSSLRTVGRPRWRRSDGQGEREVNRAPTFGGAVAGQLRRRALVRAISCRRRWVSTVARAVDVVPAAVGVELPGQRVVGQVHLEDLLEAGLQLGLVDRHQRLDAPVEVAGHQVGRADEDPWAGRDRRRWRSGRSGCARGSGRRSTAPGCAPTARARPGMRQQMPRMMRSISTPALDAS